MSEPWEELDLDGIGHGSVLSELLVELKDDWAQQEDEELEERLGLRVDSLEVAIRRMCAVEEVRTAMYSAIQCDLAGRPPVETLGNLVGQLRRIVGEAGAK